MTLQEILELRQISGTGEWVRPEGLGKISEAIAALRGLLDALDRQTSEGKPCRVAGEDKEGMHYYVPLPKEE